MNKQMILQFENDLEYQNEAISSICDIFEGEETSLKNEKVETVILQ